MIREHEQGIVHPGASIITMESNWKNRKSTFQAQRLSRSDLLPTSPSIARSTSLKNYMALAALRNGQGNIDLAGELLKTLYWTFYLSDSSTVQEQKENLLAAEKALKASIVHAADTETWALSDTDYLSRLCFGFTTLSYRHCPCIGWKRLSIDYRSFLLGTKGFRALLYNCGAISRYRERRLFADTGRRRKQN